MTESLRHLGYGLVYASLPSNSPVFFINNNFFQGTLSSFRSSDLSFQVRPELQAVGRCRSRQRERRRPAEAPPQQALPQPGKIPVGKLLYLIGFTLDC